MIQKIKGGERRNIQRKAKTDRVIQKLRHPYKTNKKTERERDRLRDRQAGREGKSQRDRQTEKDRHKEIDKQRKRVTKR